MYWKSKVYYQFSHRNVGLEDQFDNWGPLDALSLSVIIFFSLADSLLITFGAKKIAAK